MKTWTIVTCQAKTVTKPFTGLNQATLEFKWNSFIFCSVWSIGVRAQKDVILIVRGQQKGRMPWHYCLTFYCMAGASNLKVTALQLRSTRLLLDWNFKCSRAQLHTNRYFRWRQQLNIFIQITYFSLENKSKYIWNSWDGSGLSWDSFEIFGENANGMRL